MDWMEEQLVEKGQKIRGRERLPNDRKHQNHPFLFL